MNSKDKKLMNDIETAIKNKSREDLVSVFNNIYNEYYGLIKYIAIKIVRNNADAEDIVQECFLKLFESIDRIQIINLKYYLTTTAKNMSFNLMKSKNKQVELNDEIVNNQENDESKIKQMIDELKTVLNDEEIDIIIKYLIFEYSFLDISKEYKMSTFSISSKYWRAIKKIKKETTKK